MFMSVNSLAKNYDIISLYIQQNSSNGVCLKDNQKYFFKISSYNSIDNEIKGYELASKYKIPIPYIHEIICNNSYKTIIYEYDDSIKYNSGLLNDSLNDNSNLNEFIKLWDNIINSYVFKLISNKTSLGVAYHRFILERINNRFGVWKEWDNQRLELGNRVIDIKEMLQNTYNYILDNKPQDIVISHGDPGDMNIGIKPVFFDFETFGHNPISLEFATFFWNIFLGGMYFFPKYHCNKYILHNQCYQYLSGIDMHYNIQQNTIKIKKFSVEMNNKRYYALFNLIEKFNNFYKVNGISIDTSELIFMLIFRILTIIEYDLINYKDKIMLLACSYIFYEGIFSNNIFEYLCINIKKIISNIKNFII